jgi:hypothetical protein
MRLPKPPDLPLFISGKNMSEVKHTEGPWEAVEYEPGGGVGMVHIGDITIAGVYHGGDSDELSFADARLIAAAPDLLEACKEMDARLLRCIALGLSASDAYDSFYQEVVHAAIAKALGEHS